MNRNIAAGLLVFVACSNPSGDDRSERAVRVMEAPEVQDIPAVNSSHFPDSIGYVYEGSHAKILWLQNLPSFESVDAFERYLRAVSSRGLSGEFVVSELQAVAPILGEPELEDIAKRAMQSTRLMVQYSNVAHDYGEALSQAASQYNADSQKLGEIAADAARVGTMLQTLDDVSPVPALPSAPASGIEVLSTGSELPEAVLLGKQRHLAEAIGALHVALASRSVEAYGEAFSKVYAAQMDSSVRTVATEALGVDHTNAVLRGHPLDGVILQYVLQGSSIERPMAFEQLRLMNQVNLLSNDVSVSRAELVIALLLIEEGRRQGEDDLSFSYFNVWSHVQDVDWLVAEYLRVKGSGTSQEVLSMVENIVAGIGSV